MDFLTEMDFWEFEISNKNTFPTDWSEEKRNQYIGWKRKKDFDSKVNAERVEKEAKDNFKKTMAKLRKQR